MTHDVRYNHEWLQSIRQTEELIRQSKAILDDVPIEHRSLIKQQFDAHVESFRNDLRFGFGTKESQVVICEIINLAINLAGAERWRAKAESGSRE